MKKILIVDDDEIIVELLTVVLEDAGYSTVSAFDGAGGHVKNPGALSRFVVD